MSVFAAPSAFYALLVSNDEGHAAVRAAFASGPVGEAADDVAGKSGPKRHSQCGSHAEVDRRARRVFAGSHAD